MAPRIVVPLDGSDHAEQVIPWVDQLAAMMQAEVELVGVVEHDAMDDAVEAEVEFNDRLTTGLPPTMPAGFDPRSETGAAGRFGFGGARMLFQRTSNLHETVLEGEPAEAIVGHAQETGAALIAMASHGRTGLARTVLGSVTGSVIGHSHVPVFVVRVGLQRPAELSRRVLAPLDMSDLGEAGLLAITPLAKAFGWHVILFHALDIPPATVAVQGAVVPLGRAPQHEPDEANAYLDAAAARLTAEGVDVEVQLGAGDADDSIAAAAVDNGVGLIAMSTHGRSGVRRWVLGSVAEALVAKASVPVLVVRAPDVGTS